MWVLVCVICIGVGLLVMFCRGDWKIYGCFGMCGEFLLEFGIVDVGVFVLRVWRGMLCDCVFEVLVGVLFIDRVIVRVRGF